MVVHIRSTASFTRNGPCRRPKSPRRPSRPIARGLLRIAYRMLGSRSEAEDVVQNAWLRWVAVDQTKVSAPYPFLARIVTRLCLDEMKSARARRETYVGALAARSTRRERGRWLTKMT